MSHKKSINGKKIKKSNIACQMPVAVRPGASLMRSIIWQDFYWSKPSNKKGER
jgi:hypothetical protein